MERGIYRIIHRNNKQITRFGLLSWVVVMIQDFRDFTPCWLACSYISVLKQWLPAVGVGRVSGGVKKDYWLLKDYCSTVVKGRLFYYDPCLLLHTDWCLSSGCVVATRIPDRGHLLVYEEYRSLWRLSYSTRILYPENGDIAFLPASMMFALRY